MTDSYFTTINPTRHDFVIPYGQSHPIIVQFTDDNDQPKDMTHFSVQILVKRNNSDSDEKAILRKQIPLTEESVYKFVFTPQEIKTMGEGVHYYDLWLKKNDGAIWQQAGVYGSFTINMLTTWSQ